MTTEPPKVRTSLPSVFLFTNLCCCRVWRLTWSDCTSWWLMNSSTNATNRKSTRNCSSHLPSSTACSSNGASMVCLDGTSSTASMILISRHGSNGNILMSAYPLTVELLSVGVWEFAQYLLGWVRRNTVGCSQVPGWCPVSCCLEEAVDLAPFAADCWGELWRSRDGWLGSKAFVDVHQWSLLWCCSLYSILQVRWRWLRIRPRCLISLLFSLALVVYCLLLCMVSSGDSYEC